VLDLGCGIGGPAREICRFSRASVTGVNNNAHQVARATQLTAASGRFVAGRCTFVQSDFMKLPFEDASYDHAYAIEATCHAPDPAACYTEIARCIKPGGMFVCYEWVRRRHVSLHGTMRCPPRTCSSAQLPRVQCLSS
jgi:sterol 24-C-methyltransferase